MTEDTKPTPDEPRTYYVCPLVWEMSDGKAVAVFTERDRAQGEAIVRAANQDDPEPPPGGWKLFRSTGLELLAWLHEQRALGVRHLMIGASPNPDGDAMGVYLVDLADMLRRGVALELFERLND